MGANAIDCGGCISCESQSDGYMCSTTCSLGYFSATGSSPCTPCPQNEYATGFGVTSCSSCAPGGTTSGNGSTSCICNPGYINSGPTCVACPSGTYKSASGNSACLACGANEVSDAGSAFCVCTVGYTRDGNQCVACPGGTYKTETGDGACTPCPANTFSAVLGATLNNTCLSCVPNAESNPGSATCACNVGYTRSGTQCVQCQVGSFKSTTGNQACTSCPLNSSSTTQGATSNSSCIPCGLNAIPTQGWESCACAAGYRLDGNSCVSCSQGTFKATVSNSTTCSLCGANAISNAGLTACVCSTGCTMEGSQCVLCPANTFKAASGNSSCINCGNGAVSIQGSASCSCDIGYYSNGTSCVACQSGKYKDSTGNSTCQSCGANAVSEAGSAFCVCDVGHTHDGNQCVACPAGTYKSEIGNSTCIPCAINTFSSVLGATSNTSCIPCRENTESLSGSSSCSCKSGFERNATACIACSPGTFKSASGNSSCINCGEYQYSSAAATSCLTCGPNKGPQSGSGNCTCLPGYYADGSRCLTCPLNTYKSTLGNEKCGNCSTSATSNGTACFCLLTHYGDPTTSCIACPEGKSRSQLTTSLTLVDDCAGPSAGNPGSNPLASLMGVSDTVFYIIAASVGVVIIGSIAAVIIIRNRMKRRSMEQDAANRIKLMGVNMPRQGTNLITINSPTYMSAAGMNNAITPLHSRPIFDGSYIGQGVVSPSFGNNTSRIKDAYFAERSISLGGQPTRTIPTQGITKTLSGRTLATSGVPTWHE